MILLLSDGAPLYSKTIRQRRTAHDNKINILLIGITSVALVAYLIYNDRMFRSGVTIKRSDQMFSNIDTMHVTSIKRSIPVCSLSILNTFEQNRPLPFLCMEYFCQLLPKAK